MPQQALQWPHPHMINPQQNVNPAPGFQHHLQQFLVQPQHPQQQQNIPPHSVGPQPVAQYVQMMHPQHPGFPQPALIQNGHLGTPQNGGSDVQQQLGQMTLSQNTPIVQLQNGGVVLSSNGQMLQYPNGQILTSQSSQIIPNVNGQMLHPHPGQILQSPNGPLGGLVQSTPSHPQQTPMETPQPMVVPSLPQQPHLDQVHPPAPVQIVHHPHGFALPPGYQVVDQQWQQSAQPPSVPPTPPHTSQPPPPFPPPNFSQPPPNYQPPGISPPSLRVAPSPRYETPPKTPGLSCSPHPYISPPPSLHQSGEGATSTAEIPDLRHQFLSTQLLPQAGQLVLLPPLPHDRSVQTIQLLTPAQEGTFHVQTIILPILKIQDQPPPPPPLPVPVPAPVTTSPLPVKKEKPVWDQDILLNQVDSTGFPTVMQGVDLEQVKQFASEFKSTRLQLGLTQTQVGLALTGTSEDQAVSQSTICRFEKLEITAMQVKKLLPQLRAWLAEARRRDSAGLPVLSPALEGSDVGTLQKEAKKRKKRTVFNPDTVNMLTEEFTANPSPSAGNISEIADRLGLDKETVRVWFCNKRQQSRKTQP